MVTPLDTLLAIKALNLEPSLTASDRQVGIVLIEHFNRRTGRCDPSINRMADLLSCCARTIIRATQRLEKAGLFRKVKHGGYSNRNSYEPNWARLSELQERWKAQLLERSKNRRKQVSPAQCNESHADGDKPGTQTFTENLSKKTCLQGLPTKQKGETSPQQPPDRFRITKPDHPSRVAAERRWMDEINQRFRHLPVTYTEIIARIDERAREAATTAEVKKEGGGIAYLLVHLGLKDG